jgi:hypothetical protein
MQINNDDYINNYFNNSAHKVGISNSAACNSN